METLKTQYEIDRKLETTLSSAFVVHENMEFLNPKKTRNNHRFRAKASSSQNSTTAEVYKYRNDVPSSRAQTGAYEKGIDKAETIIMLTNHILNYSIVTRQYSLLVSTNFHPVIRIPVHSRPIVNVEKTNSRFIPEDSREKGSALVQSSLLPSNDSQS